MRRVLLFPLAWLVCGGSSKVVKYFLVTIGQVAECKWRNDLILLKIFAEKVYPMTGQNDNIASFIYFYVNN